MVVASALKPTPRRELERVGHAVLEPLDNSADCTEIFRGSPFDWEHPRRFQLPLDKAEGFHLSPVYRSLGLRGRTATGHDVFQVAVELDIQNQRGYRTAVQPLGQTFFEVNENDVVERCHVKLKEDRAFDCLLERGEPQSNGDCLLPMKDDALCVSLKGQAEAGATCRIAVEQPIPKRAATEALRQAENHLEPCEQKGWYRNIACADGGRRCRPTTLCQPSGGATQ